MRTSNLTKRTEVSFVTHDIFDSKSFPPEKVKVFTEEIQQENLKTILEDFFNRKRTQYHKMFSNTLIQSLVDLFTDSVELVNSYIMDDFHEINQSILDNSKSIIYFKNSLITPADYESTVSKFKFGNNRKMFVLSLFLNPEIVSEILSKHPQIQFFTIYHSNFFNAQVKSVVSDDNDVEFSYNRGFMGAEFLCKLFRKLIFNFFDDN